MSRRSTSPGGRTEQINADKFVLTKPQSFASVVKETPINNCKFPEREQAIVFDAIANTQKNDYIIGVGDLIGSIVFDAIANTQKNDYIIGVGDLIGSSNIIFASRIANNRICIYFSSKEAVDRFVNEFKGITIQDRFITARRLVSPAKRVILSNVSPSIPHNIIENHLKQAGLDIMSSITFIGAGLNRPEYKHILSFRRQVYINPDLSKELPDSLIISYNHNTFRIFLSIDEIKCFICKKPGHIASKCTTSEKSITVTAEVHQEMTSDVLIKSMNTAETPENNDNVAKEATEVELPQLDIHKAKTSYSMKRTAPTSPDWDSISIVSEEPDVLAHDQSKVSVAPLKQQEFVKPKVSKNLN
ncbi:Zinc knuckle [Popillia japonica]|uniref:Zinc knuckle n=1 Tax=Popillia japonica TaxID=7064 RepID=A0AAW1L616_POPJA